MTVPAPPFFSSSILENYPVLNTAGPAPGIPLVIQMLDRVVWFPYSAYGLSGDDAPWAAVAVATVLNSPFCNRLVAATGQFNLKSLGPLGFGGIELPGYNFNFEGQGYGTVFNMFVAGIGLYCHGTTSLLTGYHVQGNGTKMRGFVVDGTNVPSNSQSIGVDIGDAPDLEIDCVVQNFIATGTSGGIGANPLGAVGFANSNRVTWTEKMRGHVVINNCLNAIQYATISPADSTSHMYQDMAYHVNLQAHQNALVVARQGHIMNGRLRLYGNMLVDSNPSSSSVIVLGVAGQQGHIYRERLEIYVESDPGSQPVANTPITISYGTNTDNQIQACKGYMRFLDGYQSANLPTVEPGYFVFFGQVTGDPILSGVSADAGTGFECIAGQPRIRAIGFYDGAGGIYVNSGDYFKFQLTANITVNLAPNPGGGVPGGGFAGPRHVVIVIQQAAAGSKTVAWPHPGSPSVATPTVFWAGGVAPVMTAGANAFDIYELTTYDGVTYFGRFTQNLS